MYFPVGLSFPCTRDICSPSNVATVVPFVILSVLQNTPHPFDFGVHSLTSTIADAPPDTDAAAADAVVEAAAVSDAADGDDANAAAVVDAVGSGLGSTDTEVAVGATNATSAAASDSADGADADADVPVAAGGTYSVTVL